MASQQQCHGRKSARPKPPTEIYQIKITLADSKPSIWRRVAVSSDITLAELHHVIQRAMGWWDCHLHEFKIAGRSYGPNYDFESEPSHSPAEWL